LILIVDFAETLFCRSWDFKQNQKIKQKSKFWPFQGAHVTRTIKNQFAAKIPFRREVRCAATRAVSVD